jgi:predicted Zn-dependent protease
MSRSWWYAVVVAVLFSWALPAGAADDKKAKKEQQRQEREAKELQKEISRYEKLREFALKLYENDREFREAVEQDYERVLREHSDIAFNNNISRRSRIVQVQEDRIRLHEGLYDNLVVQSYINALGQRLVPPDSDKLYAFRLIASPVPSAQTLATGTIYLSTGFAAMMNSEAQLAFVLAHEMAHVYKDHWKLKSMLRLAEPEYNQRQAQKAALFTAIGAAVGAAVGGATKGGQGAAVGAGLGAAAGAVVGLVSNPLMNVDFDRVQEDEADRFAMETLLRLNYDVQEVPRVYLALENAVRKDSRVGLGFIANRRRLTERKEHVQSLLEKTLKAEIEARRSRGGLIGDNPRFRHLMAELRRDNGILAFYYDMFAVARDQLQEAVSIRTNDPAAQYYYAKVLQLTGRTDDERKMADDAFAMAVQHDKRDLYFGAHLHRALMQLNSAGDEAVRQRAIQELQEYVQSYVRFAEFNVLGASLLPPNLETVYDYLVTLGVEDWKPSLPERTASLLAASAPAAAPQPAPAASEPAPPKPVPAVPAAAREPVPARRAPARSAAPVPLVPKKQ